MIAWSVAWLALMACDSPSVSGDPEIEVGTGQFDYESVVEGQELLIVRGPQGGYHVWLGIAAKGLDPRNLRVDSQLFEVPEEGEEVDEKEGPQKVGEAFFFFQTLFESDEEGLFVTAGLPHQVERGDVRDELLRLEVMVTDRDDRTASGSMVIVPVNEFSEEEPADE